MFTARRKPWFITVCLRIGIGLLACGSQAISQDTPPANPLALTPRVITASGQKFRLVPIGGFTFPWATAVLPDGSILVTEINHNSVRIIRNGVLDPSPIAALPAVLQGERGDRGGVDIALHPRFADNHWVYFAYWKPKAAEPNVATAVLARGRFDGRKFSDVRDLFVADAWNDGPAAARIAFARDGKVFMVIGSPMVNVYPYGNNAPGRYGTSFDAQNPANDGGKVLRLNDDGTVPADNPFVHRAGFKPEIYALGIRNSIGIYVHPDTGDLWLTDNGPRGGDEIDLIKPGLNYGWPLVTYGRAYAYDPQGKRSGVNVPPNVQPPSQAPGMEEPYLIWVPSIAPAGIIFYTGDKFPLWKGNIFVGALRGSSLQRITLDRQGNETAREDLLLDLGQRIRDVKQGADGLLYLTTDEKEGAVLRIEPLPAAGS